MMDQELEEKRSVLKILDPEKEAGLTDTYFRFVLRTEDPETCERADAVYRQAVDDALREERRAFLDAWYSLEEDHGTFVYQYLRDEFKAWIDEREKVN